MAMSDLLEVEKAYLAGFFDGEGTVAVYQSAAPSKHGPRPIWIFQVQIANTSLRSLERVVSLVGGTISRKSQGKPNWRQGYVWRICGNGAAEFMRAVRPYTVIKSVEIDEALRFRSLGKSRGHLQTPLELAEKLGIVTRIKELKRA